MQLITKPLMEEEAQFLSSEMIRTSRSFRMDPLPNQEFEISYKPEADSFVNEKLDSFRTVGKYL